MSDHYTILGTTKIASSAEIKAAYRKLVKVYHPDKNPNDFEAVDKFRQIQLAYEILMDPIARSKYDGKISYTEYFSQQTTQPKKPQGRGKKYSFTEEDLKRRQYYKEHYKQHYDSGKKGNSQEEKRKYNETRYILMSIPLAIALLFFIVNIYERKDKKKEVETIGKKTPDNDTTLNSNEGALEKISTSSEPYKYFFAPAGINKNNLQVVQVTNYSGSDAVVCVVDALTNKVVRHYFIANNFFLYFEYLPNGKYYLRNYLGDNFNASKKVSGTEATGAFENEKQYQGFKENFFTIKSEKHDTITFDLIYFKNNKSKSVINSADFFTR